MKIYKYFIKQNECRLRRFIYLSAAKRYFLANSAHHSRSHFRIEDRLGNIIMSNKLLTVQQFDNFKL